jgi:MIP family channel proteins
MEEHAIEYRSNASRQSIDFERLVEKDTGFGIQITLLEDLNCKFWIAVTAEFFATCTFLWLAYSSVMSLWGTPAVLIGAGFAFGLGLMTAIYCFGHISGCNANPAVSLALALTGRITAVRMLFYMIAQTAGAITANALVRAVSLERYQAMSGAANAIFNLDHPSYGYVPEMLGTAVLVYTVLVATDKYKNDYLQSFGPFAIGMALVVIHFSSLGITNTSVNPARAVGSCVVSGNCANMDVFTVGPFIGAILAVAINELFRFRKGF